MNKFIFYTYDTDGYTYSSDIIIPFESEKTKDEIEFEFLEKCKQYLEAYEEYEKESKKWHDEFSKPIKKGIPVPTPRLYPTPVKFMLFEDDFSSYVKYWLTNEREYKFYTLEEWFESKKVEI